MRFLELEIDSVLSIFGTMGTSRPHAIEIVISLLFAVSMGSALAYVYIRIRRGNAKVQRSFVQSLVLLPLVAAAVTIIIGNSVARAFGLLGAVSVVRFRTSIKNAADMAFVFMAIAMGIASGSALFLVGIIAFAAFAVSFAILEFGRLGKKEKNRLSFMISMDTQKPSDAVKWLNDVIGEIASIKLQQAGIGKSGDLVYKVVLISQCTEADLMERLSPVNESIVSALKVISSD